MSTHFEADLAAAAAAATAYYSGTESGLTDAEYDALIDRITAAADADPTLAARADVDALLNRVAAGTAAVAGDVTHTVPMLSMEKVRTAAEVDKFVAKIAGGYVIEAKMDGVAVAAHYRDGDLVQVVTRGDGRAGKDVTARVFSKYGTSNIHGLPATLPNNQSGEIRGEVYMTASDFEYSQTNRVAAGEEPFSNPRNAAAGLMNRPDDPGYPVQLSFAGYDFNLDGCQDDSYTVRVHHALTAGFLISAASTISSGSRPDVAATLDSIEGERDAKVFPIDGAVIKADSITERANLGAGSRAPKWAVAYKYEAEKATTILEGIERTVGRTGNIAYTAILTPVEVDGSVVARATLHNADFITERDLRVGDTVTVFKAGDIIPRVEEPLLGLRPADSVPYVAPDMCPSCGEVLDQSAAIWKCVTPACSVAGGLAYAVSRDALDVDGFSVRIAEALAEHAGVTDFADLFTLTADDYATLPMGVTSTGKPRLLGAATATKIVAGLETAKRAPFNRVITALGLRGTGRGVSRRLAAHFPSLRDLQAATEADLAAMPMGTFSSTGKALTLGPAKAALVVAQLATPYYQAVIGKLEAAGVNTTADTPPAAYGAGAAPSGNAPLAGMNVVVSGTVPGYSRTTVAEAIESAGGKASSSVTAKTNLLVSEPSTTSKYVKAQELGVRIVTPAEFLELLGG